MEIPRRQFMHTGALLLGCAASRQSRATVPGEVIRVGLVTDIHHAHLQAKGTRWYRHSLAKLEKAVGLFNSCPMQAAVCLGDIIDSGDGSLESERQNLIEVHDVWSQLTCDKHHVFGNHCVDLLTKDEFCEVTGARPTYYHVDYGNWRLIFLDACYRQDGTPYSRKQFKWNDSFIPPDQQSWLVGVLAGAPAHAAVFVHQRLDGREKDLCVSNHASIRSILAGSGRVRAVFAGHSHQNECLLLDGIPYLVLRALVEEAGPANNAFGMLDLRCDGSMQLDGFFRQNSSALVAI